MSLGSSPCTFDDRMVIDLTQSPEGPNRKLKAVHLNVRNGCWEIIPKTKEVLCWGFSSKACCLYMETKHQPETQF